MKSEDTEMAYWLAARDFHEARRRADVQSILARLTRKPSELLSYETVRDQLRAGTPTPRGMRDVPLDAIVGSVGRYTDFTRTFLPRHDSDEERWARVMLATTSLEGLPAVELYQLGEAYFVKDGHHRISVARQLGATHIQAYVTEVQTRVPLTPDASPDDIILKAEYADFLEQTGIDTLRPGADFTLTAPGKYGELLEHIQVHRYFMGLEEKREISQAEAVKHWYDTVYLPVVDVIRQRGVLRYFPGRTEADLYLWVQEYQAALQEQLGWAIDTDEAATDLVGRFSPKPRKVVARLGERLLDAVTPDELEGGPPPGAWRRDWLRERQDQRLFTDILVPLGADFARWRAFEQAAIIARREGGRLRGLHVVATEAERTAAAALAVQAEFERRCQEADLSGNLVIEVGRVARKICERARWADLVVLDLNYPPASQPIARLSSGLRTLIQRCPRPILTVPQQARHIQRALLAYDGSPKADEALFVAAYLAGCWEIPLTLLTVLENGPEAESPTRAWEYLGARKIPATFVQERGPVVEWLFKTARRQKSDLLVMGGYGFSPMLEVVLGSTLDQVLRESELPVLICR